MSDFQQKKITWHRKGRENMLRKDKTIIRTKLRYNQTQRCMELPDEKFEVNITNVFRALMVTMDKQIRGVISVEELKIMTKRRKC